MSRKTLLVLAASQYQLDTIRTAQRLGYRVITTDNIPENPGHALADRSYPIDTTDREAVLDIAERERIDGIISPCTDVAICTGAYVAEELGLVGPPLNAATVVSSKLLFREFQTAHDLPAPEAHSLSRDSLPDGDLFREGWWVVKPDHSSGSKGIFIVRSQPEFRERLPDTLSFSPDGRGILERYIDGLQGTCEGVLRDGKLGFAVVLDRQTASPPYVATQGHHLPSRLPSTSRERLFILLEKIWAMLDVRDGPFDCDFVANDDQVYILEMSPRTGGNSISRLLQVACGFDIVEYSVRQACGDAFTVPSRPDINPAALVLLGVKEEGRLTYERTECDALRREPWVHSLIFDLEPGMPVRPFINGRHRVGEAIVLGRNRDEVDIRAVELRRRLCVRGN